MRKTIDTFPAAARRGLAALALGLAMVAAIPVVAFGQSSTALNVSMWSPNEQALLQAKCPAARDLHAPGAVYQVKFTIRVRNGPGGKAVLTVRKGVRFISDWFILSRLRNYRCIARAPGQEWVLGVPVIRHGHPGWLPRSDLTFVRFLRS